jgi:RNA polymerase sigma-70 factor, ECF subfamily
MSSSSPPTPPIGFEALAEHRPYLLKVARLQLQDAHLAEDCVSDVLTHAYERREGFRGDSSLRTWLTAILKNRVVDMLRKQWREQPLDPLPSEENEFDPLFDTSGHWASRPSDIPDPEKLCEQSAFLDAVKLCIERLPRRIGQVFVLREVLESDTREICKELGLTTSNVWVQLYRARMMLRMCLEKSGFAPTNAKG